MKESRIDTRATGIPPDAKTVTLPTGDPDDQRIAAAFARMVEQVEALGTEKDDAIRSVERFRASYVREGAEHDKTKELLARAEDDLDRAVSERKKLADAIRLALPYMGPGPTLEAFGIAREDCALAHIDFFGGVDGAAGILIEAMESAGEDVPMLPIRPCDCRSCAGLQASAEAREKHVAAYTNVAAWKTDPLQPADLPAAGSEAATGSQDRAHLTPEPTGAASPEDSQKVLCCGECGAVNEIPDAPHQDRYREALEKIAESGCNESGNRPDCYAQSIARAADRKSVV